MSRGSSGARHGIERENMSSDQRRSCLPPSAYQQTRRDSHSTARKQQECVSLAGRRSVKRRQASWLTPVGATRLTALARRDKQLVAGGGTARDLARTLLSNYFKIRDTREERFPPYLTDSLSHTLTEGERERETRRVQGRRQDAAAGGMLSCQSTRPASPPRIASHQINERNHASSANNGKREKEGRT